MGVRCPHVARIASTQIVEIGANVVASPREGCAIYDRKPPSCTAFACLYRLGYVIDDRYRPDRCGLVLTTSNDQVTAFLGRQILFVHEAWEGAADAITNLDMLDALASNDIVGIMRLGKSIRWRGPAEAMRRDRPKLERMGEISFREHGEAIASWDTEKAIAWGRASDASATPESSTSA